MGSVFLSVVVAVIQESNTQTKRASPREPARRRPVPMLKRARFANTPGTRKVFALPFVIAVDAGVRWRRLEVRWAGGSRLMALGH
jgi:hypothetical protein